jgi:wyosine [tRNA(Phe)-imidazoG37] synthetase (radical SAM superfamily)
MITFGPIPSRRFGASLGINNLPAKHCTYACGYCQVAVEAVPELHRRAFYPLHELVAAVETKVAAVRAARQPIDRLTFVPDGEPTLDVHLGEAIRALRPLGLPVGVITNASLLMLAEVRADLAAADFVSIKVDAVEETRWRRVNRPHPRLVLAEVLAGALAFAREYRGELSTETMLVAGVNDDVASVEQVAELVATLAPAHAFLSPPTRPPVDPAVAAPSAEVLARAYRAFAGIVPVAVLLGGEDPGSFGQSGDPVADLLAIVAVHPMRERAALAYLARRSGALGDANQAAEDAGPVTGAAGGVDTGEPAGPRSGPRSGPGSAPGSAALEALLAAGLVARRWYRGESFLVGRADASRQAGGGGS